MTGVHAIPAGTPFLDALARGIRARVGDDPLALARATVLLPTRRAARALATAFLRSGDGVATVAPRVLTLGDVDDDDEAWSEADGVERDGVPPAIAPLERLVRLADLVRDRDEIGGDPAAALRLAEALARLLDSFALEDVTLDRLATVVGDDLAVHWQRSLAALEAARGRWPALLAAQGAIDPAVRRVRLLRARAARWRETPPAGLVVAAGSTGSVAATRELLGVIAALPDGHVVLPGLDRALDDAGWAEVPSDPAHPQHGIATLLDALGVARAEVGDWIPGLAASPRAGLLAEALRPATTTEAWRVAAGPDDAAFAGLERVEADDADEEAGVVALALRGALAIPGRTAALVTPDRGLARRVAAELRRWGVEVDDSAGAPLAGSLPVVLLRLVAELAAEDSAVALLACLKHPAARAGRPRGELRRAARRLERRFLRRTGPPAGVAALAAACADEPRGADLAPLAADLVAAVAPLAALLAAPSVAPRALLRTHVALAEWLASGPDAPEAAALWGGEAGEAAAAFVAGLDAALDAMAPIAGAAWPALFEATLADHAIRPKRARHPRLAIWGPLEARLQAADLVILGGLNEGTWPPAARDDPWLSRGMRATLGLPPPERRIGQSAHDFTMAVAAGDVLLTRSRKVDGAPTQPARWLQRLDALLGADRRWAATQATPWRAWRAALDAPGEVRPIEPPAPRPPLDARPRKLSVTRIETLIRDPYAIWAREILRLRPLDPLDPDAAARERGTAIHTALKAFFDATRGAWPADPLPVLLACGERAFAPHAARPAVRAIWWPRFRRVATWLAAWEIERRATGVVPLAAEARGERAFARPGGGFELYGRADRLDRLDDESLSILDWKTGRAPSDAEMASGLAPQLALEAIIAAAGGFESVAAGATGELLHLRLTGGEPAVEIRAYAPPRNRPEMTLVRLIEATEAGLAKLIDQFDDPATPYLSQPRPRFAHDFTGDYDHLARAREWAAGEDES